MVRAFALHLILHRTGIRMRKAMGREKWTFIFYCLCVILDKGTTVNYVICRSPPDVEHASFAPNGFFMQGQNVTYTCDTPYVISGTTRNNATVTCSENGTWEGVPTCAVLCESPPDVEHASVTPDDMLTQGQNVTYTCDTQYVISGTTISNAILTCSENGTWEGVPTCEAYCDRPARVYNAITYRGEGIISNNDFFRGGDKVIYRCYPGYAIAQNHEYQISSTCMSDGNWTVTPTCVAICGKPPVIENGYDTCAASIHITGDSTTMGCNPGYVTEGTGQTQTLVTCNTEGKWETVPNCLKNCGVPPNVTNATVTSGNVFTPGQTVMYTCDPQFVIPDLNINTKNITCQEGGEWEQAPICQAECGAPAAISNGDVTSGDIFTLGENVTYTCDEGYVIRGTKLSKSVSMCQADGSWSSTPTCMPNCGPVPAVSHSTNDATNTVYVQGDKVTYTCDSDFVIQGTLLPRTTIECQASGRWQVSPVCVENCGAPPTVTNATVTSGNVFTPGQTVMYTCDPQFIIPDIKDNTKNITCQDGGEWEQAPICQVNCGAPATISNGSVTSGDKFTTGEEVTYVCDETYVIVGTKLIKSSSTCQADGSWRHVPACTPNCGPAPRGIHSSNNAAGTVYVTGDQVTYTCDSNHVIRVQWTFFTQTTLECEASGKWQETPICEANCGPPDIVSHASRTPSGTMFTPGDIVTWTCQDRYVVQSTNLQNAQVVCKGDGTWTNKPVCIAYCGKHPEVDHSIINGTGSQEGDRRTYRCVEGHTLVGESDIACLDTSEWENSPHCPADCGNAPSLRNGNLVGSGNLENDTRDITCKNGYVLVGSSSIKCLSNGQWEVLPVCQASEVNALQNQFGNSERPLSTGTTVAMTFAILFFILLCCAIIYIIVRSQGTQFGNRKKASSTIGRGSKSGSSVAGQTESVPTHEYETPIPRAYAADRSWRDMLF